MNLKAALSSHAEDIFLASGAIALSAGVGLAWGAAFGLMAAGALALAYGIWITERGQ